jgi:hypothetical protein
MKIATTKKAINSNFGKIIKIGYCDAQNLLQYKSAFAYSHGVYGWACDYYQINNVCISTGYNPIGQSVDYKKICELEKQAEKITHDYNLSYEDRVKQCDALLSELIAL